MVLQELLNVMHSEDVLRVFVAKPHEKRYRDYRAVFCGRKRELPLGAIIRDYAVATAFPYVELQTNGEPYEKTTSFSGALYLEVIVRRPVQETKTGDEEEDSGNTAFTPTIEGPVQSM